MQMNYFINYCQCNMFYLKIEKAIFLWANLSFNIVMLFCLLIPLAKKKKDY